ncbi:MAG: OmpA family protein [Chitinophagales bacterium]|nr:OmpA family protein [Chitinophagales bacterium]
MLKNAWVLFMVLITYLGNAQPDTIRLINPSFEGRVQQGGQDFTGINGWYDCGAINFPNETPPDIHPNGYWKNNLPASDKNTYLGMVVRDNGTYESVSTRLEKPLKAGQCYKFSVHLARAERYVSLSRMTMNETNYITPTVLRIWGGKGFCNEQELLAESVAVNNTSWQINTFEFRPQTDIYSLTFSAYYKTPTFMPYSGNILVDGGSDIIQIACPGEAPIQKAIVANHPTKKKQTTAKTTKTKPTNTTKTTKTAKTTPTVESATVASTNNYKPKVLHELQKDKVKQGQIIEIKNLYFAMDSFNISKNSYDVLEDIYVFLMTNKKVVVEIGGHTNNIPSDEYCNRLSTARAKSVAEYLIGLGVSPEKIQFKGYGKMKPIADNRTPLGRSKNQRVELKILSFEE